MFEELNLRADKAFNMYTNILPAEIEYAEPPDEEEIFANITGLGLDPDMIYRVTVPVADEVEDDDEDEPPVIDTLTEGYLLVITGNRAIYIARSEHDGYYAVSSNFNESTVANSHLDAQGWLSDEDLTDFILDVIDQYFFN